MFLACRQVARRRNWSSASGTYWAPLLAGCGSVCLSLLVESWRSIERPPRIFMGGGGLLPNTRLPPVSSSLASLTEPFRWTPLAGGLLLLLLLLLRAACG